MRAFLFPLGKISVGARPGNCFYLYSPPLAKSMASLIRWWASTTMETRDAAGKIARGIAVFLLSPALTLLSPQPHLQPPPANPQSSCHPCLPSTWVPPFLGTEGRTQPPNSRCTSAGEEGKGLKLAPCFWNQSQINPRFPKYAIKL